MPQVGTLGDIVFETSQEKIRTFHDMRYQGNANYAVHARHGAAGLAEYTGRDPLKMQMEIHLSRSIGVDPEKEIDEIESVTRDKKTLTLVLGGKIRGEYKWVIESYSVKANHFDRNGNIIDADISIDLLEYLKS